MSPLVLVLWLHYAHAFWRPPVKSHQQIKEDLKKPSPNSVTTFLEACHDKKGHSMILEDVCFWCTCENAHKAICRAIASCEKLAYKTDVLVLPKNRSRVARSARFSRKKVDFPSVMNVRKGPTSPSATCSHASKPYTIGCPPNDWCKGCTICDCQKSGKWDCNILSYCPESQSNKGMKHLVPDFRKRTARDLMFSTIAMRHIRSSSTQNPKKPTLKRGITSTSSKIPKLTLKPKLDFMDNKFNVKKNNTRIKKQLIYQKKPFRNPSKEITLKHHTDQPGHPNSVLENKVHINTNSKNTRPDQKIHKNCGNSNKTNEMFYKIKKRGLVNLGPKNFNNSHVKDNMAKMNVKREVSNNTKNITEKSAAAPNKTRTKREIAANTDETGNGDKNEIAVHTKLHFISESLPSKPVKPSIQINTLVQENKRQRKKLDFIDNTLDNKYYYGINDGRPRRRAQNSKKKTEKYKSADTCEPVVSSYSVGCPAEDWCTNGCTICDCTQKRKWNCYTLSFCPDGKGGYFMIKQNTKHKPLVGDKNMVSPTIISQPIVNTNIFHSPSKKIASVASSIIAPFLENTEKNCANDTYILESEEEISEVYQRITPKPHKKVISEKADKAYTFDQESPKTDYSKFYKSNMVNFEDLILNNNYLAQTDVDGLVRVTKVPNKKGSKRKGQKSKSNYEDSEKLRLHKIAVKNKKIRLDKQGHPKVKTYLNAHGVKNKRKELQKVRVKNKSLTKAVNKTTSRSKRGLDNESTTLEGRLPATITEPEEILFNNNLTE